MTKDHDLEPTLVLERDQLDLWLGCFVVLDPERVIGQGHEVVTKDLDTVENESS
jgi:hypothetical protein